MLWIALGMTDTGFHESVELDINKRWERGTPHHPKSVEMYRVLEAFDWLYGGDRFCFKSGGDGDNGEHLMYLMDIYFEQEDVERKKGD
jgi:hypothetical protein